MMDILLDKKSGPLGIVIDLVSKKIIKMRRVTVAYPQPDSALDNVVMAEMQRSADTQNFQVQYARKMVQKYQCYPDR